MPSWLHQALMWLHIASGVVALLSGAVAIAARKGGGMHVAAGTWFFAAMVILGASAAVLEPFREQPGSPINGLIVLYFVATSWVAARRHDGVSGRFEMAACAAALAMGALTIWGGISGASTPAGPGPVFAIGGLLLIGGLGDLNAVLRRRLSPVQRLSRHLWRMCFAFFIATGSFFLGQQGVLPAAVRGSPWLFLLAFAPFGVMAFWLVRIRFAKALRTLTSRLPVAPATAQLEI